MLPERRYVHDRAAVLAALAAGDCTYVLYTRDLMALRADTRPVPPGQPVDPAEVYDAVSGNWAWYRNQRAKYVWLSSSGGKVWIADRDRRPMGMADLRRQA